MKKWRVLAARAWRDDGFWTLLSLYVYRRLTGGRMRTFPPDGHVGQVSTSLAVTAPRQLRLSSIRLRRLQRRADTSGARLWRLICEWEMRLPPSLLQPSGQHWVQPGNASAVVGEDGSTPPTGIISTSTRF